MQFTTLIISALAATAFAYPTNDKPGHGGGNGGGNDGGNDGGNGGGNGGGGSSYKPCGGNGVLYSSAQCCATDVLGVADLDCAPPPQFPSSAMNFQSVCSAIGQRPRCCVLPIAGQALLCQAPIGTN